MKPEKNKEAQASDKRLRKARTVAYLSKIDPLRQGQGLDAIDQKPKHDSSKTEVTLDAVMQEAEGKRGKPGAKNKAETPQAKLFLLVRSLLPKFPPLLAHAHIKPKKT